MLTSRPAAYKGDVVLPEFAQVQIDDLEDERIERIEQAPVRADVAPVGRQDFVGWQYSLGTLCDKRLLGGEARLCDWADDE